MTTRRNFIKQAGILAASLALAPTMANAWGKPGRPIGLQLYSLREILKNNPASVLEAVAKAGYKEVETYGYSPKGNFFGLTPKEFGSVLNNNGLTAPSGHFNLDGFYLSNKIDDIKDYIETANLIGTKYITCPSINGKLKSAEGYKKIAEQLNIAGELAKKSGVKVAYHNHGFEFDKFEDRTGLDILLSETDAKLVDFELDLYWAYYAQQNPLALFKKYPNRFKMWHVKDMDKTNKKWNTEIGNGSINYKALFNRKTLANVKHIFVEQETNYKPDHLTSIKTSIDFINNNLL